MGTCGPDYDLINISVCSKIFLSSDIYIDIAGFGKENFIQVIIY